MTIDAQDKACVAFNDFFINTVDSPSEPVMKAVGATYKAYKRATKGDASPVDFLDWIATRQQTYSDKVEPLMDCRRFNVPALPCYPAQMHGMTFAKATLYVLDLLSNADDKRHLKTHLSTFETSQLELKAVA